jgi:hypothetical protein
MFLATPVPARSVAVIGFLQLCGLTRDCDPHWRNRPASG